MSNWVSIIIYGSDDTTIAIQYSDKTRDGSCLLVQDRGAVDPTAKVLYVKF